MLSRLWRRRPRRFFGVHQVSRASAPYYEARGGPSIAVMATAQARRPQATLLSSSLFPAGLFPASLFAVCFFAVCCLGGCAASAPQDDCPSAVLTSSASCHPRCESDGDCLAPSVCDSASRRCYRPAIACVPTGTSTSPAEAASPCPPEQECELLSRTCVPMPGAACTSDEDCRLGESCGGPGSRCAPSPNNVPCRRDAECPSGAICRPILVPGAPPGSAPTLRTVCGPPLGAGEAGAPCRSGGECQSGLCLRTGTCFGGCQAETAAIDCHKRAGVICGVAVISFGADSSGPPQLATLPSCTLAPAPCRTDADCEASGGTCQLFVDPKAPTQLTTGCLPPRGPGRASAPCRSDGECASGTCLGGYCFSACAGAGDCRAGMACRATALQVDRVAGTPLACAPGRACTSARQCLASDETCAPQPADSGPVLLCVPGRGRPTGSSCGGPGDCQSGQCGERGLCLGGCGSDGDCPRGPAGEAELCRPSLVRLGDRSATLNVCQVAMPPCQRDADCKLSLTVCRPYQSLDDSTRIAPGCGPAVHLGKASAGALCSSDGDCASGRCLTTQPRVCFGLCKVDADCAASRRCYTDYAWHLTSGVDGQPSATYDATSACAPDIGSRRPCTGDGSAADCPSGEQCVAVPDAQQRAWLKRCQRPVGTKPAGGPCSEDKECQSGRCQVPGGGTQKRCIGLCSTAGPVVCSAPTTCRAGSLEVRSGVSAALTYCQ